VDEKRASSPTVSVSIRERLVDELVDYIVVFFQSKAIGPELHIIIHLTPELVVHFQQLLRSDAVRVKSVHR